MVEKYCWLKSAISMCQRSLPVLRVEADQIIVRRLHVEPVVPHAQAAVADVRAALGLPDVVPQLAAVARIHGPGVIGRGEIENAVDFQDRGANIGVAAGLGRAFAANDGRGSAAARVHRPAAIEPCRDARDPRQRQVLDVRLIELRQRAVALPG